MSSRFRGWDTNDKVKKAVRDKYGGAPIRKKGAGNANSKSVKKICDALHGAGIKHTTEYAFHPKRKWRFDILIDGHMVAIEYNGGQWTGGRHVRGLGYAGDLDKINAAQILGYTVLQYTTSHLNDGTSKIIDDVKAAIKSRHDAQVF